MPSDSNGVYSLPAGYLAVTGEVIQANQHNPPLEDIASAMSARLMRSGAAPMTGPLKIVDGTAGAPAVQFATATSTGFYKTTDGVGVSIGGTKVAEFTAGGILSGARFIGELFDWTGSTAPALCVLPYGQTLSRTTYADLWAFAQIEIAAGNTLYNNGNGTTTFGIPDTRGRVRATKDNIGGVAAGRLTSTTMSPDGNTLGAVSLLTQTRTLVTGNLPAYTPSGSVSSSGVFSKNRTGIGYTAGGQQAWMQVPDGFIDNLGPAANAVTVTSSFTGIAQGGVSTPISIVQPTIITNCALFAGA